MENSVSAEEIHLRIATLHDMQAVYDLAMDPLVRANSFQSDAIPYAQHVEWFTKKLSDQDSCILVALYENTFAGQVRFDIEENTATIGISVTAPYRGRKLALPLLQKGIKQFCNQYPAVTAIEAFIKPENQASINLFERAHFKFTEDTTQRDQPAKKFLYHKPL